MAIRRAIDDDFGRWPGVRKDRAEALARRLQGASTRADGELTAREREVAALLADGLTNGQLAERLFISPKTAAVHVSNILAKLGLSTRAEIAAWAVRHELSRACRTQWVAAQQPARRRAAVRADRGRVRWRRGSLSVQLEPTVRSGRWVRWWRSRRSRARRRVWCASSSTGR